MTSRPVIYVNRITNLSDARYCAGMGADLLGFVVTPGHPDYVSPIQFKEIMGWVSGPRRVVEIVGSEPVNVGEVIAQYAPDLLHVALAESDLERLPSFPLIIETQTADWTLLEDAIEHTKRQIEYVILSGSPTAWSARIAKTNLAPILISLNENAGSIKALQDSTEVSGFVLQGTPELKPGLKDYDNLSRILETLDL